MATDTIAIVQKSHSRKSNPIALPFDAEDVQKSIPAMQAILLHLSRTPSRGLQFWRCCLTPLRNPPVWVSRCIVNNGTFSQCK